MPRHLQSFQVLRRKKLAQIGLKESTDRTPATAFVGFQRRGQCFVRHLDTFQNQSPQVRKLLQGLPDRMREPLPRGACMQKRGDRRDCRCGNKRTQVKKSKEREREREERGIERCSPRMSRERSCVNFERRPVKKEGAEDSLFCD